MDPPSSIGVIDAGPLGTDADDASLRSASIPDQMIRAAVRRKITFTP
jgi:hypothetical protein